MALNEINGSTWFREELYSDVAQTFLVSKVLYDHTSTDPDGKKLQEIMVLETPRFGRVLTIDGIVQTTEADEVYYHEPIVHCAANSCIRPPETALLIGCDGGTLREIVKYSSIKEIDVVDIDREIIDVMLKYISSIPGDGFSDPRTKLTIADGAVFVKDKIKENKKYDLIIVDSPDPIGPASSLFKASFYHDIAELLSPGGIVVRQTGSSLFQPDELPDNYLQMMKTFPDGEVRGMVSAVPTYVGGYFTFVIASNQKGVFQESLNSLEDRTKMLPADSLKWYSAEMHRASMILPAGLRQRLLVK